MMVRAWPWGAASAVRGRRLSIYSARRRGAEDERGREPRAWRAFTVLMCRGPGHLAGSLARQVSHSYRGARPAHELRTSGGYGMVWGSAFEFADVAGGQRAGRWLCAAPRNTGCVIGVGSERHSMVATKRRGHSMCRRLAVAAFQSTSVAGAQAGLEGLHE
ncbi:hypothetical protein SORBI_3006G266850 [Sorghum bicolor]|uniref:Uncharacterized protein n=1 Tax=Sorghum bicolor TaxID=4558 RepID=A0A1Z5RGD1_SORBI|nr:hypothetical protein SORBI_3006G266850 [Sorghum bicolor]